MSARELLLSLPVWGEWIEIQRLLKTLVWADSLSPCGESGLKSTRENLAEIAGGLSPCGESGLKWVVPEACVKAQEGLSTCGESGLKSEVQALSDCD